MPRPGAEPARRPHSHAFAQDAAESHVGAAEARRSFLAVWVALGAMFAYRLSATVVDLDLYHQLALIREWRALGALPRVDLYAFTPTVVPFIHHEWGAGAVAYAVSTTFGGTGILLLRDALGFALAIVAVSTALRLGAAPAVVAVVSPVAMILVESGFPPVRAHAYSFLLAALTLHLCERDRAGRHAWAWALVPLFALWVNIHGGFILGVILLMAYGAERALQRGPFLHLGLVLLAVVAAALVNPYGAGYYAHLLRALRLERALVPEWGPIWSGVVPTHQKFTYCVAIGLVVYALAFGRGPRRNGLLLLVATAGASALHHRLLPFFGTAWVVYCPALLDGTVLQEACSRIVRHPRAQLVVSATTALVAAALLCSVKPLRLQVPNDPIEGDPDGVPYYPVGAVAYLREQRFHGNLLTPFNQGAYVLWKLYPSVKVSLDSRYEAAYDPALAEELIRLYQSGKGLPEILERYRPDAILVPRHSGLADAPIPLLQVYEDASFRVYARHGSRLSPVANVQPSPDQFP